MTDAPSRSPPAFGSWIALCIGAIGWGTTLPYSVYGAVVASLGIAFVAIALRSGERVLLTAGAAGLFVGVLVAAGDGTPPGFVLLGATAAVLAWDVGHHAIGIGRQLGRDARTFEAEFSHVVASIAAGAVIVLFAYVGFLLPVAIRLRVAVFLFLLAVGLFAVALAPREILRFEAFE